MAAAAGGMTNRVGRTTRGSRAGAGGWLALLALLVSAGCGGGTPSAAPLDAPQARDVLQTALEAWKGGGTIESLQSREPPIHVLDVDWSKGSKLVQYRVGGEGTPADGNLVLPVELTIQDASGKETKLPVKYLVTTSPSLTVMRDIL